MFLNSTLPISKIPSVLPACPYHDYIISLLLCNASGNGHDDAIKWKHFPRYWPFVWGIHRSPVNSPHRGQWRGALMFSLIYDRINGWVSNHGAGDLRFHRAHYDVIVMNIESQSSAWLSAAICYSCAADACLYERVSEMVISLYKSAISKCCFSYRIP